MHRTKMSELTSKIIESLQMNNEFNDAIITVTQISTDSLNNDPSSSVPSSSPLSSSPSSSSLSSSVSSSLSSSFLQNTDNEWIIKNCTETEVYNVTTIAPIEFARPMYGIGMPILFLVTAIANSLIIAILTRRHMKSPTNLVLLWMAVADLLTLAFPAPGYFYMYTLGQHHHLLSGTSQCYLYSAMIEHIPMAFHTSSIWLTILLALQRYIYICHPTLARTLCTIPKVSRAILAIFVAAISSQASRFFDTRYDEIVCLDPTSTPQSSVPTEPNLVITCQQQISSWVPELYFPFYFLFRIVFVNLVPCIALVILNVLLFLALQEAQKKRRKLLKDKPDSGNRSLSNSTTYMLMVVVTVFLLVEIPMAVATMVHLLTNLGVFSFEGDSHLPALQLTILLCNFIIMLSFPLNFAIYCGMSAQFRNTFQAMIRSWIRIGPKNAGSRITPVTNGEETGSADTARNQRQIVPESNTLAVISTEVDLNTN